MKNKKLKILLIGAGRFGCQHLRILKDFEKRDFINLVGVVVKTKETAKKIKKDFRIRTFTRFPNSLLKKIDAVDIVTPASTHFELCRKCLKFTNVFIEKPLTLKTIEAEKIVKIANKNKKILVVGHIFRFNAAVAKIAEIVSKNFQKLYFIEGKFTGESIPPPDCGAIFEDLHLFDILDFIFKKEPISIYAVTSNPIRPKSQFEDEAKIIVNYDNFSAFLQVGWVGLEKNRSLNLYFTDMEVHSNLLAQNLVIKKEGQKTKILNLRQVEPLKIELANFVNSLNNKVKPYPDGKIGARIVKIAEHALKSAVKNQIINYSK